VKKDVLRLRVFEEGGSLNLPGQSDADLGTVMLPLASLSDGEEKALQLPLQGEKAQLPGNWGPEGVQHAAGDRRGAACSWGACLRQEGVALPHQVASAMHAWPCWPSAADHALPRPSRPP